MSVICLCIYGYNLPRKTAFPNSPSSILILILLLLKIVTSCADPGQSATMSNIFKLLSHTICVFMEKYDFRFRNISASSPPVNYNNVLI